MGHRYKYIILGSIALNLLLIGVGIGYFSRDLSSKRPPFVPPPPMLQTLSPEKREIFNKAMKTLNEKNKDLGRQIEQKRAEILNTLTTPSFDATIFEQKSLELHELHGRMKGQLDKTIEELATQFNQEERQALANLLRQKGPPPDLAPPGPPPPPYGPPHGPPPHGFPPPGPPPPGFPPPGP